MRTAVLVGGKLQGVEACCLAKIAGIRTILIDRNGEVPAAGLCDEFVLLDVHRDAEQLAAVLKRADFVLPTLENRKVLEVLSSAAKEVHVPLAFDLAAYDITSSKLRSDRLIRENGIPAPAYYPGCDAPYIVKPSGESGSRGVRRMETAAELEAFLKEADRAEQWVAQEFLTGPSYSIEVIGVPGNYRTYRITEIHMDEVYDCRRVTSPCRITEAQAENFAQMGKKLAELVQLHGIMDVEVIDDHGILKVLEIDARLPSQTPLCVYYASGVNLLQELSDIVLTGAFQHEQQDAGRHCCYEHYLVCGGSGQGVGEHVFSESGRLHLRRDHLGSDLVLSDFAEGQWCGTFLNTADSEEELKEKLCRLHSQLHSRNG